jgi:hypothetical protein
MDKVQTPFLKLRQVLSESDNQEYGTSQERLHFRRPKAKRKSGSHALEFRGPRLATADGTEATGLATEAGRDIAYEWMSPFLIRFVDSVGHR